MGTVCKYRPSLSSFEEASMALGEQSLAPCLRALHPASQPLLRTLSVGTVQGWHVGLCCVVALGFGGLLETCDPFPCHRRSGAPKIAVCSPVQHGVKSTDDWEVASVKLRCWYLGATGDSGVDCLVLGLHGLGRKS